MSSKSRWIVLLISTPLVVLTAVGGLLGASSARQETYPQLRVFSDVVSLILNGYVEKVDVDKVMEGAMRGLADGLDASSAYLTPEEVSFVDSGAALAAGDVGLVVTRQIYLRIVGVRDGSPASRAGLRTGDFIRGIEGKSTRDISAFAGTRLLHGAPGSKVALMVFRNNVAEPHDVTLVREAIKGDPVTSKKLPGGDAYVRVASFAAGAAASIRRQIDVQKQAGAAAVIVDLRGTADGPLDEGIAAAKLFLKPGTTVAIRAGRGPDRTKTTAAAGDGALTMPVELLISNGTAGAAEVFAAALSGNNRAELVGEPTAGIAAVQRLVRLPENRGLWLTYARQLTIDGQPIHEKGLRPNVGVDEPSVAFDEAPPTTDDALDKAVERLKAKKAA